MHKICKVWISNPSHHKKKNSLKLETLRKTKTIKYLFLFEEAQKKL